MENNHRDFLKKKREKEWDDNNTIDEGKETYNTSFVIPGMTSQNRDKVNNTSYGYSQGRMSYGDDHNCNRRDNGENRSNERTFSSSNSYNYNSKHGSLQNNNSSYSRNSFNQSQDYNRGNYNRGNNNNYNYPKKNEQLNKNYSKDANDKGTLQTPLTNKYKLPIENHRSTILNYINTHQVIVIAGETGCGKTTQVPKYIYEEFRQRKDNSLNMIITQPRRIAAVSIAKRLCQELGVELKKEVGFHVGRNPEFDSEKTKILIVTTGIFLQRLIHEKELPEITHVILDEVHERDIDIDFVMILIKHILKNHPKMKLILMSATISTELFANYFSKNNISNLELDDYYKNLPKDPKKESEEINGWKNIIIEEKKPFNNEDDGWTVDYTNQVSNYNYQRNYQNLQNIIFSNGSDKSRVNLNKFMNSSEEDVPAPVIKIEEKLFPVKMHYLSDILENYIRPDYPDFVKQLPMNFGFDRSAPRTADYIFDISALLIKKIHINYKEKGLYSILVFLPGLYEIEFMREKILSYMNEESELLQILFLHSNLPDEDQSKVFEQSNKRKIILSTNIAESSITIPDIYYVIDLCLCKELRYNLKTNHQSLEINWASKASCNQRAGRAGRVADGFVYRLLTKEFYDHEIEAFSSPELIRTPLEKLILKIKVWDCGEPEKILGRAIQPPKMKHIDQAITNLQNLGALTIPTGKSATGELTELGKVYSELPIDLKYSRFIVLSFCFDLIEPAIVICSILTQEKNFFKIKKTAKRHYEIKKTFDQGTGNDFVALFNAYKDWSRKYGKDKEDFHRSKQTFITREERQWCSDHDIDDRVIREVRNVMRDLKRRLIKLHLISEDQRTHYDFGRDNDALFYFNIVLAGAFYGNFIKCGFYNPEKIQKMNKIKEYEAKQAITVKCIIPAISDNQVKDFFNTFGRIEDFKRYGEECIIAFGKDNYQESIKKVMLCGGYKHVAQEFIINYKPEGHNYEVPFQLKRPEYLYQLKFYDLFSQNSVEIDSCSVNHTLIAENEKTISSYFLVTEHYHTKKQKFHSKITAKLPEISMLDYLMMMVFSPFVRFYPDEHNRQYEKFRILGSELEFRFTHMFSSIDVGQINTIRVKMNDIIKHVGDEGKIAVERKILKDTLCNLINKRRSKIISKQEWWDLLYKHYPHLEKKIPHGQNFMSGFVPNEKSSQEEKKNNDFLPQIEILKGLNDRHLFTDDGGLEIEEERKCFIEMRKNIIGYFDKMKSLINLTETEVVCAVCGSYICMAKNLVKVETWYEITGFIGNFMHIINQNDVITQNNSYCNYTIKEYELSGDFQWISCSKKHILGIYLEGKHLVSESSELELKFPLLHVVKFQEFYNEGYSKIKDFEAKCLIHRKKEIQNLYCELCHFRAKEPNDFLNHIDKNNIHKLNLTELIEEEF